MEPRLLHGHRFPRADVVWHHCPSTQRNHNTVFLFLVPWSWNELLSEPGRQEPLHDRSSAQSTCSDSKLTRILVQFYLICCVVFFNRCSVFVPGLCPSVLGPGSVWNRSKVLWIKLSARWVDVTQSNDLRKDSGGGNTTSPPSVLFFNALHYLWSTLICSSQRRVGHEVKGRSWRSAPCLRSLSPELLSHSAFITCKSKHSTKASVEKKRNIFCL